MMKITGRKGANTVARLNRRMAGVILALAWPTMMEQLLQTAVQYIDTAMVGSLGTQATAAVGATSTVSWLIGSSTAALGIGFLAYIARAHGAGDRERARRASAQAVLTVLSIRSMPATAATAARAVPVET